MKPPVCGPTPDLELRTAAAMTWRLSLQLESEEETNCRVGSRSFGISGQRALKNTNPKLRALGFRVYVEDSGPGRWD